MRVKQIIAVEKTQELDITRATLLSIKEATQIPFKLRIYTNYWWLRSPGGMSDRVAVICIDGSAHDFGRTVDRSNGAVRPALRIKNLNSSNLQIGDKFEFGGKEFEIISDNLAFCLEDIGTYYFREDWEATDANDYKKSDLKRYVNDWFKNVSA